MKKFLFALLVGSALFASCGSDCELTELDEIIIGDWSHLGSDITFNADGSMDDPDNVFEASINDIDLLDKSWELESDTLLTITCSNEDPAASLSFDYSILEYDCDKIRANAFIDVSFNRK